MRIHEIEVGSKKRLASHHTDLAFVGEIRHLQFNGLRLLGRDSQHLLREASGDMLKFSGLPLNLVDLSTVVTFKMADCYLMLPRLTLYDAFQLEFSFKTRQPDGLLLFNSGKAIQGSDFLAVELIQGGLAISFDMGHGASLQEKRVGQRNHLSDGNWHQIRISR